MNRVTKFFLGVVCSGGIIVLIYSYSQPSLIRGITSEISAQDKEFQDRVLAKFSGNVTDIQMSKILVKQGFNITTREDGTKIASYKTSSFCSTLWWISWNEKPDGYVNNIQARNNVGCL